MQKSLHSLFKNSETLIYLLFFFFFSFSVIILQLLNYSTASLLLTGFSYIVCLVLVYFVSYKSLDNIISAIVNKKFLYAVFAIVLARTGMTLLHGYIKINSFNNYAALVVILSLLFLYIASIFFYYYQKHSFSFEKLFLIQALLFGSALLLVFPLYGVADEPQHMRTAYYVSNKIMGIETSLEGIYMRKDDSNFSFPYPEYDVNNINNYLSDLLRPLEDSELVFVPNSVGTWQTIEFARRPLVFYSQQYQYIVPALGITIGRLFNLNTISVYLLGRAFNLLFYILLLYTSIKLIPFGKSLLYSISLFPMSLHLAASMSRDVFRISTAILCVSLTIHLIYGENKYSKKKQSFLVIVLFLLSALLFPLRSYVYSPIALLPLLLYANKKNIIDNGFLAKSVIAIFILIVCFTIFKTFIHPDPLVEEPIKNLSWAPAQGYSVEYFINHPLSLITMIRTTMFNRGVWLIDHMICAPLGWLSIAVPEIFILALKVVLLINIFRRSYESINPPTFFYSCSFLLALLSLLLIFVGMAVTWTRNGIPEVEGVQGRYFTPLLLPLLLPFRSRRISVGEEVDQMIVPLLFLFTTFVVQYIMIYYI